MKSTSPFSKQTFPSVFFIVTLALAAAIGGAYVTGKILSSELTSARLQFSGKAVGSQEPLDRTANSYDVDRLEKSIAVLTRDVRSLEKRIDEFREPSVRIDEEIISRRNSSENAKEESGTDEKGNVLSESDIHPGNDPIIELDEILGEASHDPGSVTTLATLQGALNSMVSTSLNVSSTTCSALVCRIDFQHRDDSDLAEAQRELIVKLGWEATYITKTEPVPGTSNMFESVLYIDKRSSPGA